MSAPSLGDGGRHRHRPWRLQPASIIKSVDRGEQGGRDGLGMALSFGAVFPPAADQNQIRPDEARTGLVTVKV